MRWAGHVISMGDNRNTYKVFVWKRKDHLGYLDIDERIILKSIKRMGTA